MTMKKRIWFVVFLLSGIAVYGQGSLQYNQVLLVGNSASTVPAGKVWKVEGALPAVNFVRYTASSTSVPNPSASSDYFIIVNGSPVAAGIIASGVTCGYTGSTSSMSSVYICLNDAVFPMWLTSGTTLAAGNNILYLNVIEFNVIVP